MLLYATKLRVVGYATIVTRIEFGYIYLYFTHEEMHAKYSKGKARIQI